MNDDFISFCFNFFGSRFNNCVDESVGVIMLKSFGKAVLVLLMPVGVVLAGFTLSHEIMKWGAIIFLSLVALATATALFWINED